MQEHPTVVGFETPESPSSSYMNVYPGNEDEAREPPLVPPHLQHTLLSCPDNRETPGTFPLPQNVIVNHLYIENREAPRSVVALGFTHRFRSKFVTVVLYKPVQRRGSNPWCIVQGVVSIQLGICHFPLVQCGLKILLQGKFSSVLHLRFFLCCISALPKIIG